MEGEMGGVCSTHGNWEMYKRFWLENLKGRYHSEELDVDGKKILEWILVK
jgi:hypothetical protein